eukprot:TRINITY_DN32932_c0_g1_i1.p1 TRINITY_DN32932_c0_g1~~TRINITY_DN32932_c0_g1_i1.p1  ORF type:complete len:317 (+),score=112.17 TRINITY_DN32932_c0_g1_i1:116-952(+)
MAGGFEIFFALAFEVWEWQHWAIYCALIFLLMGGFGMVLQGPLFWGWWCDKMPFKGRVLRNEDLGFWDYSFVTINKAITCMYVYHAVGFLRSADWITTDLAELSPVNSLVATLIALGTYDLIYVPFHRFLHLPGVYAFIHKHHHKQINPFRATFDGINVHPLEFISGEYLHLLSLWLVGRHALPLLGYRIHAAGVALFLLCTAFGASINHTRWIVRIPGVYDVRTHDTHHKYPRSNYCQYVPWFDYLYGSYLPYVRDLGAIAKSRGVESDPQLNEKTE